MAFLTEMKMENWTNVLDMKIDSDIQKKICDLEFTDFVFVG